MRGVQPQPQSLAQVIFSSLISPLYGFFNTGAGAADCGRTSCLGGAGFGATHDVRSKPSLADIRTAADSWAAVTQPCAAVKQNRTSGQKESEMGARGRRMLHLLGEHERAPARLAPDNDAAEVPGTQPSLAAKGKCLCSWRIEPFRARTRRRLHPERNARDAANIPAYDGKHLGNCHTLELRVQAAAHVFLPALQRGADAGLEGQGCSRALRTMRGFQGHIGVII